MAPSETMLAVSTHSVALPEFWKQSKVHWAPCIRYRKTHLYCQQNMFSRYFSFFSPQPLQLVLKLGPRGRANKAWKDLPPFKLRNEQIHICCNEKNIEWIAFWNHVRVYICRHRFKLPLLYLVTLVHRYPFVSHPIWQILPLERRLLLDPTRQHGGLFTVKILSTFWVIFFFIFLFTSVPLTGPLFCHNICWHQDLFLTLYELLWDHNEFLPINIVSKKPSRAILNRAWNRMGILFKYQCVLLCRTRLLEKFYSFRIVRRCQSSDRAFQASFL